MRTGISGKARTLRGAITPRSRNDFEMTVHFPREKRREDTLAADAFGQFPQLLFVKRLARVGRGFDQLREGNAYVLWQRFHCLLSCSSRFLLILIFSKCLVLFRKESWWRIGLLR